SPSRQAEMPIRGRSVTAIILRMANRRKPPISALEHISTVATRWAGSTQAFSLAALAVVGGGAGGPLFPFSDTWELTINHGTAIATFLMVFLIQRSQNKDSLAIHLKLNEIVAVLEGASNRLIDVEALSEKDLDTLHQHFSELSALARKEDDISVSHSVEEARERHSAKSHGSRRGAREK